MSKRAKAFKTLACLIALTFCFAGCHGRPGKGLNTSSRSVKLTSDYTEIAVDCSKVPGYWGSQVNDGEKFFLYTLDHSYKKGDVIRVQGAFGPAAAAVFNDETRVYQVVPIVNIIVVWKAAVSGPGEDGQPRSWKDP
jgi:hypothetical protein